MRSIDDLRVDVRHSSTISTATVRADGALVDDDGWDWYEFEITRTNQ
ncbi:MAG: hypothetical protein ABSD32_15400 [Mycobacterium sp.]